MPFEKSSLKLIKKMTEENPESRINMNQIKQHP